MLKEARRLYGLGWAVHWLKPNSKAPVKGGWSSPSRDDWTIVEKEYRRGYGLGVRMGESSFLGDGYLANIDVDIKSGDPRHQKEAFDFFEGRFPGLRNTAPCIETGYGFRFVVKTSQPLRSGKLGASSETTKVFMPTSEINRQQEGAVEKGILTREELKKGWRVRVAWEVEFMSIGKQVVLPPTIHPDTGKAYVWVKAVEGSYSIPLIRIDGLERLRERGRPIGSQTLNDFEPVVVDLVGSKLPDRIVDMILSGENVSDRSAACFSVCMAMVRAKFTDQEILSVLTDRSTFLGETAYDHRKTNSRKSAAVWVKDYCLAKAKEEVSAAHAFEEEVEELPLLPDDRAEAQAAELLESGDWFSKIARSGKEGDGPPKPTLENVVLVLTRAISFRVFLRNEFAFRDFYGCDTPWGGKNGKLLGDEDTAKIKLWLGENYRFEPAKDTISDAMTVLSARNGYDPVREWLDQLPAWDLVPRLDHWLALNFEASGDPEYLAQVFRKWVVAMVLRVYRPGAKFDWMPIFEGAQGVGKSSFGRLLVGDQYFLDWLPDLSDKDSALSLQGAWGVELGELASLRKNEIETVKAFITRTVDKVRPPYGKRWVESPRRCVFFGTTNADTYLRDDTGNRRFKPVKVGKLDFGALVRDRAQLFAEAVFIYRNELETEATLETTGEAKVYELQIQSEKMVEDEASLMLEELAKSEENPDGITRALPESSLSLSDLFGEQGPFRSWKKDTRNMMFAAKALKVFSYEKYVSKGRSYWRRKR